MSAASPSYRPVASVAAASIVLLIALVAMEQTLVPRGHAIALTGLYIFILFSVPVLAAGTTKATRFLQAEQEAGPTVAALAVAAALSLPALVVSGPGISYHESAAPVLIGLGLVAGCGLAAIMIARPFRQSGAADVSEFIFRGDGGTAAARLAAVLAALACGGLLLCAIHAGALLVAWFFAVPESAALVLFCLAVGLAAAIGGLQSVIRLAAVAFGLHLAAITVMLAQHSLAVHGFPLGQLTFGIAALEPVGELEAQLRGAGFGSVSESVTRHSITETWPSEAWIAGALLLMAGCAGLPPLLQVFSATRGPVQAMEMSIRAILAIGAGAMSIAAVAAFGRLGIYQTVLGITPPDARFEAPVLYSWGGREVPLIKACGADNASLEALITRCGEARALSMADVQINGVLAGVASADLSGLPFAFTALVTAATILLLAAFGAGAALALAGNLATGFHAIAPRSVQSRRVFVTRVAILLAVAGAGLRVSMAPPDLVATTFFSLGLCAATLLPAIAAVAWFGQAGRPALIAAMMTGAVVTLTHHVLTSVGIDLVPGTGDEIGMTLPGTEMRLPGVLSGLVGLPVAIAVLGGVALMDARGLLGGGRHGHGDGDGDADEDQLPSDDSQAAGEDART